MPEPEASFSCWVGAYEIRRLAQLPKKDRRGERDVNMPHLVQVGPAKTVRPKREAFDMAVLRLLNTKVPRAAIRFPLSRKQTIELQAHAIRLGIIRDEDARWKLRLKKEKENATYAADFADLEKSTLAIANHLGMLGLAGGAEVKTDLGYLRHESLVDWATLADQIQAIFLGRDLRRKLQENLVTSPFHGDFQTYLIYKSDGVSMHLLPKYTAGALIYHAAQMITAGTKLQNCEYCNSPFLSGGDARGGGKRRRDARFCSDECRWKHHNEMRGKAARKSKL